LSFCEKKKDSSSFDYDLIFLVYYRLFVCSPFCAKFVPHSTILLIMYVSD